MADFFHNPVDNYLHPQFVCAKFAGHGGCMRIQEMRSGRAYLTKRMSADQVTTFESRTARDVFNEDTQPVVAIRPEPKPTVQIPRSELEKNQWTVVSFDGVEAGGMTYDQASRLIKVLGENGINGLCIITDAAALNID
jgi:hypothetical protein